MNEGLTATGCLRRDRDRPRGARADSSSSSSLIDDGLVGYEHSRRERSARTRGVPLEPGPGSRRRVDLAGPPIDGRSSARRSAARLPHPHPPAGLRDGQPRALRRDRTARSRRRADPERPVLRRAPSATTGCTRTPPTGSSTSSRRPPASTRSATSSTSGASRSGRPGRDRERARDRVPQR